MAFILSGHFNKVTKTKTYRGKRYYLHTVTSKPEKISENLKEAGIPNVYTNVWHNGQNSYAIYVR